MNIHQKIEDLGGIGSDGDFGDVRRVTIEDVRRVEQHIGHTLPAEYGDFLLTYGSGWFGFKKAVVFPLQHWADGLGTIDSFWGAVPHESRSQYDLIANHDSWVTGPKREVPANLLPIASDAAGNLICLSVAGEDTGAVLLWDHEEVVWVSPEPGYENVCLIAPSFSAFINLLQVDETVEDETE